MIVDSEVSGACILKDSEIKKIYSLYSKCFQATKQISEIIDMISIIIFSYIYQIVILSTTKQKQKYNLRLEKKLFPGPPALHGFSLSTIFSIGC